MDIVITVIIISLLLSAFFSGIEIAFYQANYLEIEVDKVRGKTWAKFLSHFSTHQDRFISATLIANNISIVIYGIYFTRWVELLYPGTGIFHIANPFVSFIVITLISTFIVLVFAEFIPKAVFRMAPVYFLKFLIYPYWVFYVLVFPFRVVVTFIAQLFISLFGIKLKSRKPRFDFVDLFYLVKTHQAEKQKDEPDAIDENMIKNVIDLPNIKVRECMVPRTEIVAIDSNSSLEDARKAFINSGHSKIPVYDENVDHIKGYIHVIDLFHRPSDLKSIIRPVIHIAESMPANKLLKLFMNSHRSLGVVVDEYGGTAGIITIEDILEEIFGEIEDEFDKDILTEVVVNDKEYIFSARVEIDYLNEKYHLNLPEGDYETLGGFLLEKFERFPSRTEEIIYNGIKFKILSATENRINEVAVILP